MPDGIKPVILDYACFVRDSAGGSGAGCGWAGSGRVSGAVVGGSGEEGGVSPVWDVDRHLDVGIDDGSSDNLTTGGVFGARELLCRDYLCMAGKSQPG